MVLDEAGEPQLVLVWTPGLVPAVGVMDPSPVQVDGGISSHLVGWSWIPLEDVCGAV